MQEESEIKKSILRSHFEQAHASSRIEGHIPAPEYLADCEAVIEGIITLDELQARSLARARNADRAASLRKKLG